jgi:hypothetical protein
MKAVSSHLLWRTSFQSAKPKELFGQSSNGDCHSVVPLFSLQYKYFRNLSHNTAWLIVMQQFIHPSSIYKELHNSASASHKN